MSDALWIKFYKDGILHETATFSQAEEKTAKRIKEFQEIGIVAGDRVIVKMENSIRTAITYLGLLGLSAIAVPVNPKEAQIKIDFIIKNCNPRFVIETDGMVVKLNKIKGDFYPKKYLNQISTIIYTSGTTGQSKGVCLSVKNWESNARALIKHHKLDKSKIIATPLPLFHCNAHGFAMYTTFLSKSRLVLFNKTPKNFLEIINKEKVTIASVVPAILHKLYAEKPNWKSHNKFDYFLTAAAPLRGDLLKSIIENWKVKVIQGYGLTESTNFSCTMPIKISGALYRNIMFPNPSVGITLLGVKVKIGKDVENKEGELIVKANSNSLGYWGEPIKTKRIIQTGDIGYFKIFNRQRFYYLKGRLKEVINRGGEKIYPLELEAEIRSLGITEELSVFSIPDERFGDEIGLATTKKFNFSIFKNIPAYRCPKKVYLLDALFYTSTGKVQRNKIGRYCLSEINSKKLVWEYKK